MVRDEVLQQRQDLFVREVFALLFHELQHPAAEHIVGDPHFGKFFL